MPASIKRKAFAKVSKIFPFSRKNQSNILMYHRIIDPKDSNFILDPGMFVTPHTFEKHLRFLVNKHTIISIEEYVANFHRPELMKNCYVLTFDDGWIDFYDNAFPILKKYNLPACVFLPTSYIGTNNLMWPDELAIYKTAFDNLTNIQKTHFENEINKKIKGE